MDRNLLRYFLVPEINRRYLLRVLIVAVGAFIIFKYICIPFQVRGDSMWPTYTSGSMNFCFTPRYLLDVPERGDVVTIRMAGNRVMLLKRIVALEDDRVGFENGRLIVNGEKISEPYAAGPCDWELPPRRVRSDHVYVVGDNRRVPMERHHFGQTPASRIVGAPLW